MGALHHRHRHRHQHQSVSIHDLTQSRGASLTVLQYVSAEALNRLVRINVWMLGLLRQARLVRAAKMSFGGGRRVLGFGADEKKQGAGNAMRHGCRDGTGARAPRSTGAVKRDAHQLRVYPEHQPAKQSRHVPPLDKDKATARLTVFLLLARRNRRLERCQIPTLRHLTLLPPFSRPFSLMLLKCSRCPLVLSPPK